MTTLLPASLSDRDLLSETARAAAAERRATGALLALLAEVDARRLYLGEGFSSLFVYATRALHLSEPAAYSRITAARLARRIPAVLALLDEGAVTLTTISLLAAHLTDDNHEQVLTAARHKTRREVEMLIAALHPQPDIASSVRALPRPSATAIPVGGGGPRSSFELPLTLDLKVPGSGHAGAAPQPSRPAVIAPIAPRRYLLKITISNETHQKLQQARDLLRHVIPDGDPAAIVDRALTTLLREVERTRIGLAQRPRAAREQPDARRATATRHIPASVRRAVWTRDEGRCAFVGAAGRCPETGRLEFHHVVPFAAGGPSTVANLALRCRAHNAFEGEQRFGARATRTAAPSAPPP